MDKPFKIKIKIASFANGVKNGLEEVDALADTGAAYTSLPITLLKRLGIKPRGKRTLRLANGSLIGREYGLCEIVVENMVTAGIVLFGEEKDLPILGTNTLDEASMAVDPVNEKLIPVQAIQA